MKKVVNNEREDYNIDLLHIMRTLWHKVWILILVGVLSTCAGFLYSSFVIEPDYSSSILLYVNNSSFNVGNTDFKISASDITASQSLDKTYTVLLKNRTTLERIIKKADVDYSYKQLYQMIDASQSDATEVMNVTVTCKNPYEASKIANTIAEVLPIRISEIIAGASMEVVDSAIPNTQKVAPSITKFTATCMIIGVFFATMIIVVIAIKDDTIHDEEYILQNYDYPILAKIPNLMRDGSRGYSYKKGNFYHKKSTYESEHAGKEME